MDPLYELTQRYGCKNAIIYDESFFYSNDGFEMIKNDFEMVDKLNNEIDEEYLTYVDNTLLENFQSKYDTLRLGLFNQQESKQILMAANPLMKLNDDYTNLELIQKIFKVNVNKIETSQKTNIAKIFDVINKNIQFKNKIIDILENDFIIELTGAGNNFFDKLLSRKIEHDLLYILSKFYMKITLFQLASDNVLVNKRYLICLRRIDNFDKLILIKIVEDIRTKMLNERQNYTSILNNVPKIFDTWLEHINNTYLLINLEKVLHIIESIKHFNNKKIYFPGQSFDLVSINRYLKTDHYYSPVYDAPLYKNIIPDKLVNRDINEIHLLNNAMNVDPNVHPYPLQLEIKLDADYVRRFSLPWQKQTMSDLTITAAHHWGQRKLLLSEMHFLNHCNVDKTDDKFVILYFSGGTPGKYLTKLMEFFENTFWVIWGTNKLDKSFNDKKKDKKKKKENNVDRFIYIQSEISDIAIELMKLYTTNKDVPINQIGDLFKKESSLSNYSSGMKILNEWVKLQGAENVKYLIISDITSSFVSGFNRQDNAKLQWESSMLRQQKIVRELQPHISSVKFILPYDDLWHTDTIDYMNGRLFEQPWAREENNEWKLYSNKEEYMNTKTYNLRDAVQVHNYHNKIVRNLKYQNYGLSYKKDGKIHGYCNCHDCNLEIYIMAAWLDIKDISNLEENDKRLLWNMNKNFNQLFSEKEISLYDHMKKIEKSPNLVYDNIPMNINPTREWYVGYHINLLLEKLEKIDKNITKNVVKYMLMFMTSFKDDDYVLPFIDYSMHMMKKGMLKPINSTYVKENFDVIGEVDKLMNHAIKIFKYFDVKKDDQYLIISAMIRTVYDYKENYKSGQILKYTVIENKTKDIFKIKAEVSKNHILETVNCHVKLVEKNFLFEKEILQNIDGAELFKNRNAIYIGRIFAILQRYKNSWDDTYYTSPMPDVYGGLNITDIHNQEISIEDLPGSYVFTTLLNLNKPLSTFTSLFYDMEKNMGSVANPLNFDTYLGKSLDYITTFYPPEHELFMDIVVDSIIQLLNRRRDNKFAIIFFYPKTWNVDKLLALDTKYYMINKQRYKLTEVFDHIKQTNVQLKTHRKIIIFKTLSF